MRVVLQRVLEAGVTIDSNVVGEIGKGLLLFVGVTHEDTEKDVMYIADKIVNMRIFSDEKGLMNLSLLNVGGSILSVSQFTLYANVRKGRRPSFGESAGRELAEDIYAQLNEKLEDYGIIVRKGVFGADMGVHLINDGPVTMIIDSSEK